MGSEKKEGFDSSSYTIMIFKGSGKVKGLKISSKIVFLLSLFLVIYFIVSGFIILEYIKGRTLSQEYLGELDGLRSQTRQMKKELFRARENIKMLEEHVYSLDGKDMKKDPSKDVEEKKPLPVHESSKQPKQNEEEKRAALKEEEKSSQKGEPVQAIQTEGEGTPSDQVGVSDLNFLKTGDKLSVTFNINNKEGDTGPASGYIHMLASFGDAASSRIQTYPGTKLKDGAPAWYKSGYFFKIARFMQIKGEFNLASAEDLPSSLKIMVYDSGGTLIFEEEYGVDLAD